MRLVRSVSPRPSCAHREVVVWRTRKSLQTEGARVPIKTKEDGNYLASYLNVPGRTTVNTNVGLQTGCPTTGYDTNGDGSAASERPIIGNLSAPNESGATTTPSAL